MSPLQVTLDGDRAIVTTRVFDASQQLLFEAWTRPELLRRWYPPAGWTLTACDIDLRPGGAFRYETQKPNGKRIVQKGFFREVDAPNHLVHTEEWEDWPCGEIVITVTLAAQPGGAGTRLTSRAVYPSGEVRDQLLKSGMADGVRDTYSKLDETLLQLANSGGYVR